jgi:hypothetical protein
MGARLRKRKLGHPYTDGFGIWIMSHGGARGLLEEEGGGDVPAPASSPHMLEGVVFGLVRLKARPPRSPFSEKRSRRLRDAAVFASGSFLQSPGSHGV